MTTIYYVMFTAKQPRKRTPKRFDVRLSSDDPVAAVVAVKEYINTWKLRDVEKVFMAGYSCDESTVETSEGQHTIVFRSLFPSTNPIPLTLG